jgi:putative endonuclease
MLKSINSDFSKTYVGYTHNLEARLNKHNTNKGAKSTKGHKWVLIYKKKFKSKNEAMSFEYKLKKDKKKRKDIIKNFIK